MDRSEAEPSGVDAHAIEAGFFARADAAAPGIEPMRDLEARYRGLIDHLPAIVYIDGVGEDDRMIDVSPAIESLLGITREAWLEDFMAWERVVHPEDRDRVLAASQEAVDSSEPFRVQYRARHADGHDVWIREDAVLVRDEAGTPRYWLGLMLDVSELVSTQEGLREAREQYGALVEQIPAIVYVDVADGSWLTTYVSPQIEAILGVSPEAYRGDPDLWARMLHPEDRQRTVAAYERGRDSGLPFTMEYRLIGPDGRVVWFQDSALVLPGVDGRPAFIQGVMLDITERKDAEDRLAYLAYHDHLTDMPNKAMFDELLDLALARARRQDRGLAVLALDVDNFKLVNDSLGHEAGDHLIRQLAERLRDATREMDLVARQGGDEFLMLLADVDLSSPLTDADGVMIAAESVAHRAQEALAAPFIVDGTELYITASIGIAVWPRDGEDAGDLLRNADAAMFRAKTTGPGHAMFHERDGLRRAVEAVALDPAAEGGGGAGVAAALPAARRPPRRVDVRRRGADPLARPERRADAARRLHPPGRGDGPDRRDR